MPGYSGHRCQSVDATEAPTGAPTEAPTTTSTSTTTTATTYVPTEAPNACTPTTCLNGGTCIPTGEFIYSCQCLPGFAGFRCQITDTTEAPTASLTPAPVGYCADYPMDLENCEVNNIDISTASSGTISNLDYENSKSTWWDINVPAGETVQIDFTSFQVENEYDGLMMELDGERFFFTGGETIRNEVEPKTELNDYFKDVYGEAFALGLFTTPAGPYTATSKIVLHFSADSRVSNPGFEMNYKILWCTGEPCLNNGVCTNSVDFSTFSCECTNNYSGQTCEIPPPCFSSPCSNSGICTDSEDLTSFSCECVDLGSGSYTGDFCSIPPACASNPCLNNGECVNSGDFQFYTCSCLVNYSGAQCEISSPCASNPCGNGANCVAFTDYSNYICTNCPGTHTGWNCDIELYCSSFPDACNDGSCENDMSGIAEIGDIKITGFGCTCDEDFTGSSCEFQFPCTLFPCKYNNTITGNCTESATENLSDYTCGCDLGYQGRNCDELTPYPCDSNPCQNDGVCTNNGYESYECECINLPEGFEEQIRANIYFLGDNCEISTPCVLPRLQK